MTYGIAVNTSFRIPPNESSHAVDSGYQFTQDTMLHSLMPHMHYRGKSFRYTAKYPDGKQEVLLDVPNYDFNWQNVYELDKPMLMPDKTVLLCRAVFDNSDENLANPDPDKAVSWGDQSEDEMMLGSFVMSLPDWIKHGVYPTVEPINGHQYKVKFRYRPAQKETKQVSVAGTFNGWNAKTNLLRGPDDDGYFSGSLKLKKGHFEYKFVEDNTHWIHDPENPRRTGPYTNSVLRVPLGP